MQITADSMWVYTKVFSLSLCQNFDVIRQWSVQWCLTAGPAFLNEIEEIRRCGMSKFKTSALLWPNPPLCRRNQLFHWPQYMDSWLARFCILVNACQWKPLGSHFTPVKTLDRHTDFCTCQCMKCIRWQVFSFKFHENSEKKNGKVPQIFKTLRYLLKIAKKICWY